jgi:DNA polymerase-3 subunit beta
MKLQVIQENLKTGLFVVGHTAGKNPNLPILNNILIESFDNNIRLVSTNLEIGVKCLLRGKIETPGTFTVDGKIFYDYVNVLPNKKIDIELLGDKLFLNADGYQTKINGLPADEYPLIPEIDKNNGFVVDLQIFKEALSQVVFAVSGSDTRLELTGVFFSYSDDDLILAATDSYRLAEKRIPIKKIGNLSGSVIIPTKTVQEVLRIISGLRGVQSEMEVYVSDGQVAFVYDNIEIVSRVIDGQYPDYKQIIPLSHKTKAKLAVNDFARAIKASALFAKSGVNDISIDLPAGKNQVVVSAISGQSGENITEVEAQTNGDDNGVVVNHRYLSDGLSNLHSDYFNLFLVDGSTPVILRPENNDDYIYIIMPIKQ